MRSHAPGFTFWITTAIFFLTPSFSYGAPPAKTEVAGPIYKGPTEVSGNITQDTTWSWTGSPYIVKGNITVNPGIKLSIGPGVQVKFDGLYELRVKGTLNAQGTAIKKILFTSSKAAPQRGDWKTIYLESAAGASQISYATIEYGNNGIYVDGCSPVLTNNTVQQINVDGIHILNGSPQTAGNIIRNTGNTGITIRNNAQPALTQNTITENPTGIRIKSDNIFTAYPDPQIEQNSIYANTDYNLKTETAGQTDNRSQMIVSAAQNWWGSPEAQTIAASILDRRDQAELPLVDFNFFLLADPGDNVMISDPSSTPVFFNPSAMESITIRYTLNLPADITLEIFLFEDQDARTLVKTLLNAQPRTSGIQTEVWDGRDDTGQFVADGVYVYVINARDHIGRQGRYDPYYFPGPVEMLNGTLIPPDFDPYRSELVTAKYDLVRPAWVTIKVGINENVSPSQADRQLVNHQPRNTLNNFEYWDGRNDLGVIVAPNRYAAAGFNMTILPDNAMVVDRRNPGLLDAFSINPIAIYPLYNQTAHISYTVSEQAVVSVSVRDEAGSIIRALEKDQMKNAGTYTVPWDGADDYGNAVDIPGHYRVSVVVTDIKGGSAARDGHVSIFR